MIATFEKDGALHVIKWTGRVRLHAESLAYCGERTDAGAGVLQVMDGAITQNRGITHEGVKLTACPKCRTAMAGS